jgi:hypothetical protein
MLLLYFRYHTMRYRFDAEGIHMRWGIQDIQLRSNVRANWHTGTRPIRRVHRTRRGPQRVGFKQKMAGPTRLELATSGVTGESAESRSFALSRFSSGIRTIVRHGMPSTDTERHRSAVETGTPTGTASGGV